MARLILVRHGESEGNRDRRFTQNPDVPITELGHRQAKQAASVIRDWFKPQHVVSSPYRRAHQTAEIIAGELALPVSIEPDLREQSFGELAGQPYDVLMDDAYRHDGPRWLWRPPSGESLADVRERAVPALDRIARDWTGRDVVVVSHGGVMFALAAHAAGAWEGCQVPPNCGIILVEMREGRYTPPEVIPID